MLANLATPAPVAWLLYLDKVAWLKKWRIDFVQLLVGSYG
jgi:hypothetical protein